MSQQQTFVLDSDGRELHGIAQWDESSAKSPRPTVIICHGFKGFMEWGFFPPLANLLVDRGFTVIRFNYSGSGMRPGDELVTDLAAFRDNTFSQELAETLRILDAAGSEIAEGQVDRRRMALVGHSRGGGASLLAAAHSEWRERLGALVTWAGVGTFDRFGDEAAKLWRSAGVVPIKNGRTGQELELGRVLLDDIEKNRQEIDLEAAAARRTAPWLILHGADDATVPITEAENLDRAATGAHELKVIANGDHTFGARHPFVGPTRELVEVFNATQTWLRRHIYA